MLWSSSVVGLALVLVLSDGLLVNSEPTTAPAKGSLDAVYPGPWLSELFYQALANFTVRNVGSTVCQKQSRMYDMHLQNHTNWAVRMSESWNRYPHGLLAGNKFQMGLYDECVNVQYPVKGQYCLAEVKITPLNGHNYSFDQTHDSGTYDHSWQRILGWVYSPIQGSRNIFNLGICIPSSCTSADLQKSLQQELNFVFSPQQIKANVEVDPILCTVQEDTYPYNISFYVTSAFFALLIVICLGATLHQYIILSREENTTETSDSNTFKTAFRQFSIIESSKMLFKFDKHNELNIVNGLKAVLMIFVLFGHRFLYFAGNPLIYTEKFEKIYINGPDVLLTNMNLVDPFFFTSGFLLFYLGFPLFKKSEPFWLKIVVPTFLRIIRILPAYCAIMAITAHFMPHFGDGPFWPQKTWQEADNCKTYWWANVLFISNFIDIKNQCLILSWYLSCDVQFFIVGLIILYIYARNRNAGIGLLAVTLAASLAVPVLYTFYTKSDGLLKVDIPFLLNPRSSETFNKSYRLSFMRATPFLTGLLAGIIVAKLNEIKFKLSKFAMFFGTALFLAIGLWSQFYGAIFYKNNRPYYPLEHAFYASYSHCTYAIIYLYGTICHFTTGYGLITKAVSNRFFVVLGRLSYCVLLVNLTVMLMSQSSQRTPYFPSFKHLFDAFIYDTIKSYTMGLVLYLFVEAPFGNLLKPTIKKRTQQSKSNPSPAVTC